MPATLSEALGADHAFLDRLYEKIRAAPDLQSKLEWRNQFTWALARHAISEELTWYPAMEKHMGQEGIDMINHDREQHQAVKEDLYRLQSMSPDNDQFDPLLERLMNHLHDHIEHEKNEDMPKLEKIISREESQKLARSFERTKMFTPTRSHPSAPNKPYFENFAVMLAAPIDKFADLFRSFPEDQRLSNPVGAQRLCPACQTNLPNPDDAVSTQLNPTEDYKTSVLSGFSPTTIMECAGRGLAFWSYQSTQEIVYQEYLAKTLTDKYGALSVQMDKIINDANSEIDSLNQKLSVMQVDQGKLKTENSNLVFTLREKSRKHQQTQELYDRLKRKEMTAATQSAAFDSVDEVLQSASDLHTRGGIDGTHHVQNMNTGPVGGQSQRQYPHVAEDTGGFEQSRMHQGSGNNGSGGRGRMLPPPANRVAQLYTNRTFHPNVESMATPSHHRAPLGVPTHLNPHLGERVRANGGAHSAGSLLSQTPSQRRPFGDVSANSANRPGVVGYGMSAGMKIGRQQAVRSGGYGTDMGNSSVNQRFFPQQPQY